MKKIKGGFIIIFLTISLSLVLSQCSRYKEPAPFFDGLYLKYRDVLSSSREKDIVWIQEIVYRFKQTEDGSFNISQNIRIRKVKKGIGIKPIYPQSAADLTVDKMGIVIKGGDYMNFLDGYPSYLWLPTWKRRPGANIMVIAREVGNKTHWKGLEVWPVIVMKNPKTQVDYYDSQTGILIGMEGTYGSREMMLIDTNFEGLKGIFLEDRKITNNPII